ncbi:ion transport protein [Aeromonas diversa CDC 2478-85]|uniref:Ion transport protein n=1 Tax=Aeromonas diversa CDC 2478-85 TaxID=1268237 RepID=N9TZ52_9GAMM|nr:potassium channel family protein [Aeromonas diversa]ENY71335.1 ion transport protein [Aeromonas diversa CDC 2478-85]
MRHHSNGLRAMDLLMALLSAVSVLLVSLRWFFGKYFTPEALALFYDVDNLLCLFFLAHFGYGLARSDQRLAYLKSNWLYLPGSLPMVEHLRWARLLQLYRVIQLLRSNPDLLAIFRRERSETHLAGILLLFFMLLGVGAGLMYWVEGGVPGSEIKSPYDAFWWALVTLSTVGYGDIVPHTDEGRFVASLVIIFGVGVFSAMSGFMASLFLRSTNKETLALQQQIHRLSQQQELLLQEIRQIKESQRRG